MATSQENLSADTADLWDSRKIKSNQTILVRHGGKPLQSKMWCFWKVQVWDKDGMASAWSRPASWSMGLMTPKDWQAQWIGAADDRPNRTREQRLGEGAADADNPPYAAVLLRKEIAIALPPVRATAYICGLGYYELAINGVKVGDHVLDPGFTDYAKRDLYDL